MDGRFIRSRGNNPAQRRRAEPEILGHTGGAQPSASSRSSGPITNAPAERKRRFPPVRHLTPALNHICSPFPRLHRASARPRKSSVRQGRRQSAAFWPTVADRALGAGRNCRASPRRPGASRAYWSVARAEAIDGQEPRRQVGLAGRGGAELGPLTPVPAVQKMRGLTAAIRLPKSSQTIRFGCASGEKARWRRRRRALFPITGLL